MTTAQIIAVLLAGGVLAKPHLGQAASWASSLTKGLGKPAPQKTTPAGPSYAAAIESLAGVRTRLKVTGCLTEAELKAVDVLTLALVAGSDA